MNAALIKAREKSGLSQNKFAEYLGISQSFLSLLESGERSPSFATARDIAEKTDEKLEILFPIYKVG